jgi:plasmid maintenance system antidote protein VapI
MTMKNDKHNIDDIIGSEKAKELTKKEHDKVRAYRKALYAKRKQEDKIDDLLVSFRFKLRNYVAQEEPEEIVLFGTYLDNLLLEMNIKKVDFAKYIAINPRNINKYLNGERKFNTEHALKLEQLFKISAKTILEVQLMNEVLVAKQRKNNNFNNLNLNDLLAS